MAPTPVPVRLGLVTSHLLLKKVYDLLQRNLEKLEEWLTSEQFQKVLDLLTCINEFLSDVPKYPAGE